MSKVFFASARSRKWRYEESMPGRLQRLLSDIGMMNYFSPDEWVAVKTHFGSDGAHRVVRPTFLRKVVEALRRMGARPFVTDTVRIRGLDYLDVANINGINHLSVGAPVVLADGLYGKDSIMVKAGEILGQIAVASVIHDVPAMVVCSHVKGHINSGYAGAIKNLAMGEGGAISCNSDWYASYFSSMRWLGINKDTYSRTVKDKVYAWQYWVDRLGYKCHLHDVSAAIGLVQLKKLDKLLVV